MHYTYDIQLILVISMFLDIKRIFHIYLFIFYFYAVTSTYGNKATVHLVSN